MKSLVLPIAVGILGVSTLLYIYFRRHDKEKKRPKDNDDDDGDKCGISNDTTASTLEFKIENNIVPLIVGRNSINLKSIIEKTETTIIFREFDQDHQMCVITGKVNNVEQAKQLIDTEKNSRPCSIITDELFLPATSCGKIEGYYSSVLHEICQKSSAKVWVDSAVRKNFLDQNRRVLISGTTEQVEFAKKLIKEKINEPLAKIQAEGDKKDELKRSPRGSLSPFGSNSNITATELPREIMLPSPEKLKNNDGRLEVFVSAVASPSRFWVQLCGSQSIELDFLVDAMTEYYNERENQKLHAIHEVHLGQICAAKFLADNKWYRAEVVAIQPNTGENLVFDVYFLDYGDQQFVGKNDILELRADFLSLRFQAIECFLAHVQPTRTVSSNVEEWDRQSIEAFESLVQVAQWKKMISKVVTYKERKSFTSQRSRESSPVPGVELYQENTDQNIALELVQMGCAEMSDKFGDLAKSAVLNITTDDDSNLNKAAGITLEKELENEKVKSFKDEIIKLSDENLTTQNLLKKSEIEENKSKSNNDLHINTNGKSDSLFGSKKIKNKKQTTADFLKSEQSAKSDWNDMMED